MTRAEDDSPEPTRTPAAETHTIYLTGEAKSPTNNPITSQWGLFFVGLVVDTETHVIVQADCTAMLGLTAEFVRGLLVGRSILDDDALVEIIQDRYHGSSQRALSAAVRSAASRYRDIEPRPTST